MALIADLDRPTTDTASQDRRFLVWGLGISFALHVLLGVVLMDRISAFEPQPEQEAVEVELVPPPEAEEPQTQETEPEAVQVPEEQPEEQQPPEQQQPPEEQKPPEDEAPKPEAASPEQTEPEPAVQAAEEQAAEEQAAPPPPPPPPAPSELSGQEGDAPQVPVMQPVEAFGEEDTAPENAEEGTPQEPAETEADAETTEPSAEETAADSDETAAGEDAQPGETEAAAENKASEDQAPDGQKPDETQPEDRPDPQTAEAEAQEEPATDETPAAEPGPPPAEDGELADQDFGTVGRIVTSALPLRKPPAPARAAAGTGSGEGGGRQAPRRADLLPARELFSRRILDDPQARTAMRGMTPGQRLNLLCMTELRAQIASVSAVPPDMLPSFRPPPGTVLEPRNAAFHSMGRWFNVAFRCETDSDVTQVERFSFKIGNEIPRSEWGSRGLTGF